jgi:sirohydrochlorin ferrochelatase
VRPILLLAHGGSSSWNKEVDQIAQAADKTFPTETAFGMATKSAMEAAIDRLHSRGVTEIAVVPLFVSSHSSVITSTQYLLGLIAEAPAELASYAKMNHRHGGSGDHSAYSPRTSSDPTKPIDLPIPVRWTNPLNRHPLVAQILISRAQSISSNPEEEAVVLVAHGPVTDEENAKWLASSTEKHSSRTISTRCAASNESSGPSLTNRKAASGITVSPQSVALGLRATSETN